MKKHRMWLSRQRDGNYMFTRLKPALNRVGDTDMFDFYIQAGEPIGIRHLCPGGIRFFYGVDIPVGQQICIWVDCVVAEVAEAA